jgi:hypothetical protein
MTEVRNQDVVVRSGSMWSGLFAGSVSAIAVLGVLLALGAAIGLAAIQPAAGNVPQVTETGIAAGIWSALSVGVACFVGAVIGAMIAGLTHRRDASSFGFSVWATSLAAIFAFGALASAAMTPNLVVNNPAQAVQQLQGAQGDNPFTTADDGVRGGGGGAAVDGDAPILPRDSNVQRAADALAGASGWFVVSSLLGMLGGTLGGLVGRHRSANERIIERRTRSRRYAYADRYGDRYADRDRYATRGVFGPTASREYPVDYQRPVAPPRSGVDYRHVRDIHDDTEAY